MAKNKPEVRTIRDMKKALRAGDRIWKFSTVADLNAWDTIEKHIGRASGERLTLQSLRHLEILVAEHLDLRLYDLAYKTLPEFAELCRQVSGLRGASARGFHQKGGRPVDTDRTRDATLAKAWKASGCRTYKEGVSVLRIRFHGLTTRQLREAVDRHRHRRRAPE